MKVSVILTSYNHGQYLKESIESVLSQTYKDFELIILDDCSTDNSWEIINEYSDERIKKIRNPINLRTDGTYEVFMNVAAGEYIAVHHSDDVWEPEKLEKEVEYLDSHENIAAVFTYVKPIDENGDEYYDDEGFYYNIFQQPNRTRYEWLQHFFYWGNCLCHPSVLMRRRLFLEEQLFDFGVAQVPDLCRWVRVCLKHDIYVLPEKLTKFRVHREGKNTSGARPEVMIRSSVELYHMLRLYSNIPSAEEFIKIFPEGEEYAKEDLYIPQYAFARICTRPEMESYTRLYGYELLYELMNDRDTARRIERVYGFTFRDLIRMTGEKDIFHVLKEGSSQCANIYFDFGNGFGDQYKIKKNFYFPDHYVYEWQIQIPFADVPGKIKAIRFDPVEGLPSLCRLDSIKLDDREIKMHPDNASGMVGDSVIFETLDPIYVSEEIDCSANNITICGTVKRLTESEQMKFYTSMQRKQQFLEEEIAKRDAWLRQLEKEKEDEKKEADRRGIWLEQLQEEKANLAGELAKRDEWLEELKRKLRTVRSD